MEICAALPSLVPFAPTVPSFPSCEFCTTHAEFIALLRRMNPEQYQVTLALISQFLEPMATHVKETVTFLAVCLPCLPDFLTMLRI